jgi:imidazolonepropionase-like amidohydrolase
LIGPGTRTIRGEGHTLMPGFIDSHFHMQHGSRAASLMKMPPRRFEHLPR